MCVGGLRSRISVQHMYYLPGRVELSLALSFLLAFVRCATPSMLLPSDAEAMQLFHPCPLDKPVLLPPDLTLPLLCNSATPTGTVCLGTLPSSPQAKPSSPDLHGYSNIFHLRILRHECHAEPSTTCNSIPWSRHMLAGEGLEQDGFRIRFRMLRRLPGQAGQHESLLTSTQRAVQTVHRNAGD